MTFYLTAINKNSLNFSDYKKISYTNRDFKRDGKKEKFEAFKIEDAIKSI